MRAMARVATGKQKKQQIAMETVPPRLRLKALVERSGKTQTGLAKAIGFSFTSGFNRYFSADKQQDRPIPFDIIQKLIPHLRGAGDPPITMEELLACTDAREIPKPVVQAFTSIVDDGDGLVSVRYRIEAGTYIHRDSNRTYGASRIGMARDYPAADQFVAVAVDGTEYEPRNTQFHCIVPRGQSLEGKRVVFGTLEHGNLMEVGVGTVTGTDSEGRPIVVHGVGHVSVVVLGVVIGVYKRE